VADAPLAAIAHSTRIVNGMDSPRKQYTMVLTVQGWFSVIRASGADIAGLDPGIGGVVMRRTLVRLPVYRQPVLREADYGDRRAAGPGHGMMAA
jgi:hypothetical protein